MLKNLAENLHKQLLFFKEFNRLAMLKQEALLFNRLQQLDEVVAQEEQLLFQIGALDQAMLKWAEQIGREIGKKPEDLTLEEITTHYPELRGIYDELDLTITAMRQLHETNSQLLNQSLKILNYTVNLLNPDDGNLYRRPEHQEPVKTTKSKAHLVDHKV